MNKLIPKHQNSSGPLLLNNYVDKPVWQQLEELYTPEWLKELSPEEEARLKTIRESERKRKEHLRKVEEEREKAKRTEFLSDWGVMTRSARSANPVPVLYHHLQNQGYKEQADEMVKNTAKAEEGVLMAIPTAYGLATATIPTLTSMATGYLGSEAGEYIGEKAETNLGAPEYTSDILGLIGGIYGGFKGMRTGKALEIPFKSNNINVYGSKKFWYDVVHNPAKTVTARKQGYYPLNFTERRLMLQQVKSRVDKGVEYARSRATRLALTPYDIKVDPKITFTGAKTAAKRYGEGAFLNNSSNLLSFNAFHNTLTGLTFPLRTNTRSLLPNWHLMYRPVLLGAHEAQHSVQNEFFTPLTRYRNFMPNKYNRYLHPDLDPDVKKAAANIIKKAKTKGLWEGSLSEMDAELVGWMAAHNYPQRWSLLLEYQQKLLAKKAAERFGPRNSASLFEELFNNMEQAGY